MDFDMKDNLTWTFILMAVVASAFGITFVGWTAVEMPELLKYYLPK